MHGKANIKFDKELTIAYHAVALSGVDAIN